MNTECAETSPDSQALPQGTHLHEFVIERVLGSGGFGITYLARDTSLGRQVVIKENLPSQFVWRETATGTVRPRHTTGTLPHRRPIRVVRHRARTGCSGAAVGKA